MTEEQIDQRIEQLNVNLIRKTHTATEERQIASELSALSSKKEKLGDVKENLKTLKNLEVRFKEVKGQIAKLNKEIGTRTDKYNEYKAELDKLHEESKKKHPEIDQLNEKIKMLKEQKTNLYTLREEKRGELHALEVEFKKLEKEILMAKENEDSKNKIKDEISLLRKKIEGLYKKISEFDAKVFDRLLIDLQQIKATSNFNLNLDLVSDLLKNRIKLPKDSKSLEDAIEMVLKARENADEHFTERTKVFRDEIEEINKEIENKMAELDKLPPTNEELLVKGGYYRAKRNDSIAN